MGDTVIGTVPCSYCVGRKAATRDSFMFMLTCCIARPLEVTCSGEREAEGACVCSVYLSVEVCITAALGEAVASADFEGVSVYESRLAASADVTSVKRNSGIMTDTVFAATGAGFGPMVGRDRYVAAEIKCGYHSG